MASCSGATPHQLTDCSCVECIEDRNCDAGEPCTANVCRSCPDGQHGTPPDDCHADHDCDVTKNQKVNEAHTDCECESGYEDADPDDGELVCTAVVLPVCNGNVNLTVDASVDVRLLPRLLGEQNEMNDGLSDNDRNTADCANLPMCLVVPDRRRVDVHKHGRRIAVLTERWQTVRGEKTVLRGTAMDYRAGRSQHRGVLGRTFGRVVFGVRTSPGLVVAAVLAGVGLAHGDPLDDYHRICGEPAAAACEALRRSNRRARCDADEILDEACREFLAHLGNRARPSREERLVLIRARTWIHRLRDNLTEELAESLCRERTALAKDHPDYAEAWYELTRCAEHHAERAALLEKALALDPMNANALRFLTGLVAQSGNDFGIDKERLFQYRTNGYEISDDMRMKLTYAGYIYQASLKAGDAAAAKALQDRVRRDVVEMLDYRSAPEGVDLACSMFDIGLGDVCVEAFESLVQIGVPIPDDMLKYIPGLLSSFQHVLGTAELATGSPLPITVAQRDRYVARLAGAMAAQPDASRSSEYYRVYAEFVAGPERLAALRKAVAANRENPDAKCSLAGELMKERAYEEAWQIYAEMAATDERAGSCDPHTELVKAGEPLGLAPR